MVPSEITLESIQEPLSEAAIEMYRALSGCERLAIVFRLNNDMRNRIAALLRKRFPEWTEQNVQQEVARRMLHGYFDAGLVADHYPLNYS